MFTIEKDDFTGLRKINSSFYGLNLFLAFQGPSDIYLRYMRDKTGVSDAFDLIYLERENGQGNIALRVCSSVAKYSGNNEWPRWEDSWPMIIDGERISLTSTTLNSIETNYELKIYELPIDIFSKICNAKEIKFSLRGRNKKIEGVFTQQHLTLFKAFEQYCFGDENEGKKLLESIGSIILDKNDPNHNNKSYNCYSCKSANLVPGNWDEFNCQKCGKSNRIIRPKNLSDEEKSKHEKRAIELISNKKMDDAVKYYADNLGLTNKGSLEKIKEFAEKNGYKSVYKNYINRKPKRNLVLGLSIVSFTSILYMIRNWGISNFDYGQGYSQNYMINLVCDILAQIAPGIYFILQFFGGLISFVNLFHLLKKK